MKMFALKKGTRGTTVLQNYQYQMADNKKFGMLRYLKHIQKVFVQYCYELIIVLSYLCLIYTLNCLLCGLYTFVKYKYTVYNGDLTQQVCGDYRQ